MHAWEAVEMMGCFNTVHNSSICNNRYTDMDIALCVRANLMQNVWTYYPHIPMYQYQLFGMST